MDWSSEKSSLPSKNGVTIRYGARAMSLIFDGHTVSGVRVKSDGTISEVKASAVVLACGGFEANPEWRARYLGPGWDLVKVRGTRFNTGDGLRMALDIGAAPFGNWSGCNAVAWDANAPEFGDLVVMSGFQKHSYPYGIMINAEGKRFADEGADVKHYTYGKYGEMLIRQPGQFAWQVFDKKVLHLLREDYRIKQVSKVRADSLEELANKMEGVDPAAFLAEVHAFNAAVQTDRPFKPGAIDGRSTVGLAIPKSNWALKIDEPPFEAYPRRLRDHLHLRRPADRGADRAGRRPRSAADPGTLCRRRNGRGHLQRQLSGRDRADIGRGVRTIGGRLGRARGARPECRRD